MCSTASIPGETANAWTPHRIRLQPPVISQTLSRRTQQRQQRNRQRTQPPVGRSPWSTSTPSRARCAVAPVVRRRVAPGKRPRPCMDTHHLAYHRRSPQVRERPFILTQSEAKRRSPFDSSRKCRVVSHTQIPAPHRSDTETSDHSRTPGPPPPSPSPHTASPRATDAQLILIPAPPSARTLHSPPHPRRRPTDRSNHPAQSSPHQPPLRPVPEKRLSQRPASHQPPEPALDPPSAPPAALASTPNVGLNDPRLACRSPSYTLEMNSAISSRCMTAFSFIVRLRPIRF